MISWFSSLTASVMHGVDNGMLVREPSTDVYGEFHGLESMSLAVAGLVRNRLRDLNEPNDNEAANVDDCVNMRTMRFQHSKGEDKGVVL